MTTRQSVRVSRRAFLGAGSLLAVGALSGCLGTGFGDERVSETVERSFVAADVGELRVRNAVGDVSVTAIGTGSVDVEVEKESRSGQRGLDDLRVDVGLEDGVLTVETSIRERAKWLETASPTSDVTITVPEGALGPAVTSVESDIGDVTLLGTRGDTRVETDLGDVTASGVDGYLSLRSNLGDVQAGDVTGLDAVHTNLGDVKVDLLSLRGDVDVGTDLGSITVGVADDLDLDLSVETEGDVDSDLRLVDSQTSRGRLTGRQNRGGSRLDVTSDLGDVSLRTISRRE